MNQRPPIPTMSITRRCQILRLVSSPLYGIVRHWESILSGNIRESHSVGTIQQIRHGMISAMEKLVAVTSSLVHKTSPVGSPITVSAPPQLAATTIAEPYIIRCLRAGTISCIIINIIVVVVMLSRLALIINVMAVISQSSLRLWRVRIICVRKSKQPLLLRISTIIIVASRKSTISAPLPT